jgi:hypothetical protein
MQLKKIYIGLTTVHRYLTAELLSLLLLNFCFRLTVNHKDGEKDPGFKSRLGH